MHVILPRHRHLRLAVAVKKAKRDLIGIARPDGELRAHRRRHAPLAQHSCHDIGFFAPGMAGDSGDRFHGLGDVGKHHARLSVQLAVSRFIAFQIDAQGCPTVPVPDRRNTARDPPENSTRTPWWLVSDLSTGSR